MNKKLHAIVTAVSDQLQQKKLHLAVAESCTGGMLAAALTSLAGASQFFSCGFVTYSNKAKQQVLGVQESTLRSHGAVSENAAQEMAQGAMRHGSADIGVAVTGIAGPTGGTVNKPVGTVCFAWGYKDQPLHTATKHFAGDRDSVREEAVKYALEKLNDLLA